MALLKCSPVVQSGWRSSSSGDARTGPDTRSPPPWCCDHRAMDPTVSYPRQSARTRRFTLGEPRSILVARDGSRVGFLRSRGGTDPANCLWVLDADTALERLVADPKALLAGGTEELTA